MRKVKKLAIMSICVLVLSVIALNVVSAADPPFARIDKTITYQQRAIVNHTVNNGYYVSITPYTISDSNGIYIENITSYLANNGLYMTHKYWRPLLKEEYHRYFNDQTLPPEYNRTKLNSISQNLTRNSSVFAKFGIDDPWDA